MVSLQKLLMFIGKTMGLFMRYQKTSVFYDLTQDFLWGMERRYDAISLKKSIFLISNYFSFETDWDEGIENWVAFHGEKETDFILLNCMIPFVFAHNSLFEKFKKFSGIKILFFNNYHEDKVFLEKRVMNDLFQIPEGYYDFTKAHTISDFIYVTYT